jgi:hypothetical protein
MSVKGPYKKSFLMKVLDKIVFILTGEKRNRQRHHKTVVKPVETESEIRQTVTLSKRSPGNRKKKFVLSGFVNNIINPDYKHRKKNHSGMETIRRPVVRANFDNDRSNDPIISDNDNHNTSQVFERRKIEALKTRKRNSFFVKLFKTKKREKHKSHDSKHIFKEEIIRILPGEGYAMLNSFGFYILAYLAVYLIYQFTETLVASNFNIDSVLFYYEIYFPIGNASPLWTRFNIIAITLASPFVSVLTSIILLRVVLMREKLNPQFRLFLLWMAFHGATHFLGAFVAGIATSQGFGYVANWLYMNVFFRILVSLIFLFLLTVTGYYSAVFALETLPTGLRQHRWKLSLALGSRFIIPWIFGGLIIIAVKYPNAIPQHYNIMVYDAIIIATMGFMVIPAFFNFKAKPRSLTDRPSRYRRPPGIMISVLAVFALILFRLAFDRGIHFVINFSFDVGFYR